MDYIGPIYGSPLVPPIILYGYATTVCFSFLLILRARYLWQRVIAFHITSFFLVGSITALTLMPAPKIRQMTPVSGSVVETAQSRITLHFTHPVKRKELQKSISPDIAGTWAFENPVYSTHLYRTLVFYPYEQLRPGTTYTVSVSGISNFLTLSPSSSFTTQFQAGTTLREIPVLGIQYDQLEGKIAVTSMFPGDTWTGVGADQPIRVQFNQEVVPSSAQSHLFITPITAGTFKWDGQIMEFWPEKEWLFGTTYTIYIAPGITNSSGEVSTYGYQITFTTQESVTKLAVPSYLQEYALSCEAAALRMALAYRGVTVSEDDLLARIGTDPTSKDGSIWGNPYVGFVGNVRGKQMVYGYGVYWEPIARAARTYRHAESFTGWTIPKLTEAIQRQHPLVIWGYVKSGQPVVWYTPGGDKITGVEDEHAFVVTGFVGSPSNPTYIIVNDPLRGEAYWTQENFQKRWQAFGQSGVIVY